jgi:tetratricopeptide (TPR) repeat protein
LEQLAEEAPTSQRVIEELATAYVSLDRFDQADRVVTAQINRAGDQPAGQWYFLRGNISLKLGDQARALKDFEQGARSDRYAPGSVAKVLQLFAKLNQYERGIEYFRGIQASVSASPIVLAPYARLLAGAGQSEQAVQQFRQAMALAIEKDPGLTRVVGDDVQAAYPGESGIALFASAPTDASLARANDRLLVRLYAVNDRFEEAVLLLDKLTDSASSDVERAGLLHEKGTVLQLATRPDDAIVAYERALEYDRRNWVTLNNLAFVLSDEKHEHQRALGYAQRAVSIADNVYTLDTLGWVYVGLKQYAPAIAELSRAIRLDPDYGWAYYHLGEAHRRNGQFGEAAEVLRSGRDVVKANNDDELLRQIDESAEKVSRRQSD